MLPPTTEPCVSKHMEEIKNMIEQTRKSLTAEEIYEACYVDVRANKAVFDSLRNNPIVTFDGNHFSYKSTHNVNNKAELLLLQKKEEFCEGIAVTDLENVYPAVMEDLQALKTSREIWIVSNSYSEKIAYLDDLHNSISVDDEVKRLFREIELPKDMIDIEKDLRKNRMIPATDTAKRQVMARFDHSTVPKSKPKRKERALSKRTMLTNAHLPELFKYFYGSTT